MGGTSKKTNQGGVLMGGGGVCGSSNGLWIYTKLVERDANDRIRSVRV